MWIKAHKTPQYLWDRNWYGPKLNYLFWVFPDFSQTGSGSGQGAIVRRCLRDPMFNRFDTIPECNRHTHTDTLTDTRRIYRT